jgi:hypothetical protein
MRIEKELIIRTYFQLCERRTMTIAALSALLLKILSNPALLAAFITFLQKTLHP